MIFIEYRAIDIIIKASFFLMSVIFFDLQTTQPLIRGHFIIHPDWVSERLTKKRMNLANRKVRNGLRYGTSEEY